MNIAVRKNMLPVPARRRPGRPGPESADRSHLRVRILDGSEQLFSEFGYSATSFRDVARLVRVNPALIGYYFGSKRALFNEVYKRRGKEVTDRWTQRLDELEAQSRRTPTVEQLLWAFLEPQFAVKTSGPGGMAFIRLQTRVHSEVTEESFALRREVYDVVAKRFIALLEKALPNVDPAEVNSRFIFCIGACLYMLADVDRADDLSDGRFNSKNTAQILKRLTAFCAGGMRLKTEKIEKTVKRGRGGGAFKER